MKNSMKQFAIGALAALLLASSMESKAQSSQHTQQSIAAATESCKQEFITYMGVNPMDYFYSNTLHYMQEISANLQRRGITVSSPGYHNGLAQEAANYKAGAADVRRQAGGNNPLELRYLTVACIAKYLQSAPSLSGITRPPTPANPAFPNSSANSSLENQRMTNDLNQARALAQRNQERADQARQGLPKLHKGGSVAHACLKPQPGGGMLNDCPYAVEYSYCVYRPVKDSWSAAFDCEKSRGGSWQVGPGPNTPVLIHTGGETTYWFACRYGETLHKPDGISPVDIEYQRGRGLLGRCGEWGSSTRK